MLVLDSVKASKAQSCAGSKKRVQFPFCSGKPTGTIATVVFSEIVCSKFIEQGKRASKIQKTAHSDCKNKVIF